jgi:DNA-binding transcriptional regulator YiaG
MPSTPTELLEQMRAAQLPRPRDRRRIREDAGLSQAQVATALNVDPMTVSRWERGVTKPRLEQAIAYRSLLDQLEEVASA